MNMKKVLFFWFITISCFSQQKNNNTLRTELLIGKSIPSYVLFTGKNPQIVIGSSYEHKNNDNSIEWQSILNNPTTGLSLYYTNYGTKAKGQSLSLIPFIEFHPIKNYKWSTKIGMGISYFDTKYNTITNSENNAISTDLTWVMQGVLYYDTQLKNDFNLRLGLGVFHHSNGHIKLPNEGLNAGLLSVSSSFNLKSKNKTNNDIFDKSKVEKYSNAFYSIRFGNGFQAFISEDSPIKSVYTLSVKGGTFYKNIVKLSLGINYRFYQHYYDYIKNNPTTFDKKSKWNASNIYLSVGAEFMLGYIGIDWETGVNIHKPFYKLHYDLQKNKSLTQYKLKNRIVGRLGLKLYVINTKKKPKNNFYIAGNINSNLGQADFSEISIGFVHNINKDKKIKNIYWY